MNGYNSFECSAYSFKLAKNLIPSMNTQKLLLFSKYKWKTNLCNVSPRRINVNYFLAQKINKRKLTFCLRLQALNFNKIVKKLTMH